MSMVAATENTTSRLPETQSQIRRNCNVCATTDSISPKVFMVHELPTPLASHKEQTTCQKRRRTLLQNATPQRTLLQNGEGMPVSDGIAIATPFNGTERSNENFAY